MLHETTAPRFPFELLDGHAQWLHGAAEADLCLAARGGQVMTPTTMDVGANASASVGIVPRPVSVLPRPASQLVRLLVATDGSPASDGALRVADLLAEREGLAVQVLSVLEPEPGPRSGLLPARLAEQVERRFEHVRAQVRGVTGVRPAWRTAINIGPVSETIGRMSEAVAADMIIVGFGQHRRLHDRTPKEPTARRIAEISATPVLIVPPHASALPRRAMLALDFSRSSIRAGRAALQMVNAPAQMHLVYVQASKEPFPLEPVDPDSAYAAGFAPFFEAVERELCAPPGVTFERVVVPSGDPVVQLLAYAAANDVDLIAMGKHGKAAHERFRMGSVSARVLGTAQCLLLISGGSERDSRDEAAAADVSLPIASRGEP